MQCPYCDRNDILTEDDMDAHVVKSHPEYSEIGEVQRSKKALNWTWAMGLCTCVYGQKGGNKKEDVLETFKYFLRELMKAEDV